MDNVEVQNHEPPPCSVVLSEIGRVFAHSPHFKVGRENIFSFRKILESWDDALNATSLQAGGTGAFSSYAGERHAMLLKSPKPTTKAQKILLSNGANVNGN